MHAAYPLLVRSISNLIIYNTVRDGVRESHFITPEQGHYVVKHTGNLALDYDNMYKRITPLALSHLVINNDYVKNLPPVLWNGEKPMHEICAAGKRLDKMGLLPSPTRIEDYLTESDMRMVRRLYGIGGLSYGNLSARALHNPEYFWMSASGVDKSKLETVGRDVLLVTGYVPERLEITLSVPENVEPRRVSVDAIEHWMIYREHPSVGAVVHVHAWWADPIPSTQVNYPCGSYEIAAEVAELVRQAPDPSRAVIGLKNHGLTITGHSIEEIFDRIEHKIVPQIPMG
jgi:ribulose-5-phosphate 4-epimerase/fuculose-1-phosphate aldolase